MNRLGFVRVGSSRQHRPHTLVGVPARPIRRVEQRWVDQLDQLIRPENTQNKNIKSVRTVKAVRTLTKGFADGCSFFSYKNNFFCCYALVAGSSGGAVNAPRMPSVGRYTHALISRVPASFQSLKTLDGACIDLERARLQQESLVNRLRDLEVDVLELPPDEDSPSSVFINDCAVILQGLLFQYFFSLEILVPGDECCIKLRRISPGVPLRGATGDF